MLLNVNNLFCYSTHRWTFWLLINAMPL